MWRSTQTPAVGRSIVAGMARIRVAVIATAVNLALALALGACDSTAKDPGFAGHWTSPQWGEHYIVVDGSTMKVIYEHDDGRVVGVLDGATFKGWWTESPSRKPSRDAGEVTFTLTVNGGTRTVDGEWRYGTDGELRQNWDLTWVGADIPADITSRFDETALFLTHP